MEGIQEAHPAWTSENHSGSKRNKSSLEMAAEAADDTGSDEFRSPSARFTSERRPRNPCNERRPAQDQSKLHSLGAQFTETERMMGLDSLQKWVKSALEQKTSSGLKFTENVRANKDFRNPAILQKMVSFCAIDEYGSHFKDYKSAGCEDYISLAERQREMAEK